MTLPLNPRSIAMAERFGAALIDINNGFLTSPVEANWTVQARDQFPDRRISDEIQHVSWNSSLPDIGPVSVSVYGQFYLSDPSNPYLGSMYLDRMDFAFSIREDWSDSDMRAFLYNAIHIVNLAHNADRLANERRDKENS